MASRFNTYMATHFAGCRLLAEGFDQYRERDVRVYMLPGYPEDVGMTDGTDAWVCPLIAESCGPHSSIVRGVSLRDLVARILAGETVPVARPGKGARKRLALDEEDDTPKRRTQSPAEETQQPSPRRRYALT